MAELKLITLSDILIIDVISEKILKELTDDDLRFMYGVNKIIKQIAYKELQRRAEKQFK